MLPLLIQLVILALVAWAARAVMAGLKAPPWLDRVLIAVVLVVAVIMVASALGIPTPAWR